MARILVTGATGFVGPEVARRLALVGHDVVAAGRRAPVDRSPIAAWIPVATQRADTDWSAALRGIEVVVHLAGHAHAESGSESARQEIRSVNVEGSAALARQAADAGVRRFIFMSSIKVYGEESGAEAFTADDPVNPQDPYAESKAEAELRIAEIGRASGMQHVTIRPPLLLGTGSKANLSRLIQLVRSGVPLPFASVRNARSLLSLSNLADLVAIAVTHSRAAEAPLLAADAGAPSTPELIQWIAAGLRRRVRMVRCPPSLLETVARPLGLGALIRKLTRSLALDTTLTTRLTGWEPRSTTQETLLRVVNE